jgi:hypothetical protein
MRANVTSSVISDELCAIENINTLHIERKEEGRGEEETATNPWYPSLQ